LPSLTDVIDAGVVVWEPFVRFAWFAWLRHSGPVPFECKLSARFPEVGAILERTWADIQSWIINCVPRELNPVYRSLRCLTAYQ
jgi:hypothetical protein